MTEALFYELAEIKDELGARGNNLEEFLVKFIHSCDKRKSPYTRDTHSTQAGVAGVVGEGCFLNKPTIIICPKPTTICQKPTTICQKPTIICQKPTTICQKPTIICQKPTTICPEPTIICQKPTIICQKPTIICQKPTMGETDGSRNQDKILYKSTGFSTLSRKAPSTPSREKRVP